MKRVHRWAAWGLTWALSLPAHAEPISARGPEGALPISARGPEGALPISARGPEGALRPRITHELRPLTTARGQGSVHRYRIPLAEVRVAFVELGYRTPLAEALGTQDLVINGGYWAYAGAARKIQGLLVVNGKRLAARAKSLSGGVLHIEAGRAQLATSDWDGSTEHTQLAIQCSPRLVFRGKPIPRLEARHLGSRTALCVRDQGRTLDAYLTAEDTRITLVELAAFLLAEGCEDALNLDGGPSTAAVSRGEAEPIGRGEALPYGLGFSLPR